MKSRPVILSLGLAIAALSAPFAHAQPAPASPIERANADAVARLYARIAAERVADVSVAQIVEGVEGYPILMGGLARAEQVGGPRTVADGVVQVRLQISGARASQLLLQAVAARPDRSPVPPDRLAYHLRMWRDRTFASTGDNVEQLDTTRPADDGARVQQAYVAPTTAPAQRPDARSDSPVAWRRPPSWISQPIVARATAQPVGSALRTARAAERSARDELRTKVLALPLSDDGIGGKLADHVEGRPDVAAAIDEAVANARVSGTDYRGDGSVEVRIAASAERLWQRLSMPR